MYGDRSVESLQRLLIMRKTIDSMVTIMNHGNLTDSLDFYGDMIQNCVLNFVRWFDMVWQVKNNNILE
jgi:hypothetical protein